MSFSIDIRLKDFMYIVIKQFTLLAWRLILKLSFVVSGKQFYAHKICLLASSDAFRAMFDGGYRVSVNLSPIIESTYIQQNDSIY